MEISPGNSCSLKGPLWPWSQNALYNTLSIPITYSALIVIINSNSNIAAVNAKSRVPKISFPYIRHTGKHINSVQSCLIYLYLQLTILRNSIPIYIHVMMTTWNDEGNGRVSTICWHITQSNDGNPWPAGSLFMPYISSIETNEILSSNIMSTLQQIIFLKNLKSSIPCKQWWESRIHRCYTILFKPRDVIGNSQRAYNFPQKAKPMATFSQITLHQDQNITSNKTPKGLVKVNQWQNWKLYARSSLI